jgi:hypothetical protein
MISCETEVHTPLETHAFAPAHLDIWDDLICHVLFLANARVHARAEQREARHGGTYGSALFCHVIRGKRREQQKDIACPPVPGLMYGDWQELF